jgi:prepilin-type N-terminal cleavage/methylation domain-containing protein
MPASPKNKWSHSVKAKRRGFTLLEVVLVAALLVIVAAITYPIASSMFAHEKVMAAADSVRGSMANARNRAVSEGRAYKLAVVPNKGNYRIAPDKPSYWSGSGAGDDSASAATGNGQALVTTDKLPNGICFATGGSSSSSSSGDDDSSADSVGWDSWSETATFLPDGTAAEDKEITLHVEGAKPVVLKLRATTGTVTMEH